MPIGLVGQILGARSERRAHQRHMAAEAARRAAEKAESVRRMAEAAEIHRQKLELVKRREIMIRRILPFIIAGVVGVGYFVVKNRGKG